MFMDLHQERQRIVNIVSTYAGGGELNAQCPLLICNESICVRRRFGKYVGAEAYLLRR